MTSKTTTTKTNKRDIYQEVTDRIITMLENGVAPWKCTWSKYGLARNASTGHIYTGINMLLMNCTKHSIPYFMTFKQVKEQGGNIKKGAKSEQVFYYNVSYKDEQDNNISQAEAQILKANERQVNVSSFIKYFNVFNVDDIENVEFKLDDVKLYDNPRIEQCDHIINNMPNPPKLTKVKADHPFYNPIGDVINMPGIKQFKGNAEYYATYFYELVHSTGHN